MKAIPHFAQSYTEARDKFVAAALACGADSFRHVHPSARGVEGEELSMDFAYLGRHDSPGLLLLISGTHGVEGFCGSGCQVALLHDREFLKAIETAGTAVLMLHALNPYGFSHLRRVNEDNADLNRNFVDFTAPLPTNDAYAEIHSLLLPATWPPAADSEARLGAWVAKHGPKAYQAAVSGGQYQFPDGMFYGGNVPAWSNRVLRQVLREHGPKRSTLAWIDVHTGLGPRGHAEKIYAGTNDAADVARSRAWWGDEVTSFLDGSSTSAPLTGINGYAARDECPHASFAGVALEYGTYPIEQVLQAFRAEHWLHNHPEAPAAQRREIKRYMRDMFYIDADDWKDMVYRQAIEACMTALARLAAAPAHV
ncbi:MAG TPA: M14 family metallopeptidase [Casimicrobiaceae bacterium]|nr:M14 family metallopeptidase [Casimicrobiaceae bacterium]